MSENLPFNTKILPGFKETINRIKQWVQRSLLPTGSVVMYMGTSIPDGWLKCDGSVFDVTKYPALHDLLGSATLPNFTNRYPKGAGSGESVGTTITAGLPNITGTFAGVGQGVGNGLSAALTGAFYRYNTVNEPSDGVRVYNSDGQRDDVFGFAASRSNSVYGRSSTVTPPTIIVNYIIKAV